MAQGGRRIGGFTFEPGPRACPKGLAIGRGGTSAPHPQPAGEPKGLQTSSGAAFGRDSDCHLYFPPSGVTLFLGFTVYIYFHMYVELQKQRPWFPHISPFVLRGDTN